MKVYFARPIHLYGSPQDKRDLLLLGKVFSEVVDPNDEQLTCDYKKKGMSVFLELVSTCDALVFRSFPDLKMSAGVVLEVKKALELGIPVLELPVLTTTRFLSVVDTKEYLKLTGER